MVNNDSAIQLTLITALPPKLIEFARKAIGAAWMAAVLATSSGVMAQMTVVTIQMNCPVTVSNVHFIGAIDQKIII